MTADGKIASHTGKSKWITGEKARNHVHQLRHWYSGIMVGIDTVLADDPMLNCRIESLRSPVRIVCDSRLRIPLDSNLCKSAREYPLIIACAREDAYRKKELEKLGAEVLCLPDANGRVSMLDLMKELGQKRDRQRTGGRRSHVKQQCDTGRPGEKMLRLYRGKILGGTEAKGRWAAKGQTARIRVCSWKSLSDRF